MDANGTKKVERKHNWSPAKGGVVMQIEFDRHILSELKNLADKDGIGSLYQMIRNACYCYVEQRTGKKFGDPKNSDNTVNAPVHKDLDVFGKVRSLFAGT